MKIVMPYKSKQKFFCQQLAFWGILIAVFTVIQFFKYGNSEALHVILIQNLRRLPAMIIVAYIFNDFLVPEYYTKKTTFKEITYK